MSTRRRHVFVATATLCLLAGLPSTATAGVAIQLFNPYNHGFGAGNGNPGVNEIGTERVPIAHGILFPSLGDLGDTDYVNFAPFYVYPTTSVYMGHGYNLDNYKSYQVVNPNPFASAYQNLHISTYPSSGSFPYFDPIAWGSSALGSPGFTGNAGTFGLTSPNVDTGVGSAAGSVTSNGEMKLKVGILRSGFGGTPVAEGALQGTYTDKFTVNGSGPSAAASISFAARANAPVLDFTDGDFYNYAVGYQMAVYERTTVQRLDEDGNPLGEAGPGIKEHWSDRGFYWMDARLQRDPFTQLPANIRVESLGDAPPGVEGVDYVKEVIDIAPTYGLGDGEVPIAYRYIRNIPVDPTDPASLHFDDPMMPFSKTSISGKYEMDIFGNFGPRLGDIELPTGVDLELVVNFFVIAGCSDLGTATCEISIDGSHTAGLGIKFLDPTVTLASQSGFAYPAEAVPEPETYALMLGGLALLGMVAMRRKVGSGA
jgi:hypothetical protein